MNIVAWFEVLSGGMLTTVQDRGRPGYGSSGLTRSGAADRRAHDAANRLVGNQPDAATLEVTGGGLAVRSVGETIVAVTGARADVTVCDRPVGDWARITLRNDDVLRIGIPNEGLRTYLAVRGGIDVPEVLGSRSTDTLSHTGPSPVRAGDSLLVGAMSGHLPDEEQFPPPPPMDDPVEIRVRPGPRDDWFTPGSLRALFHETWTVTPELDRVGIRFHGPGRLHRARHEEMPSEGMVPGSLQIPPDGHPVLFLVDHPVTGGYPVAAVAVAADQPVAAQLRPGQRVRFVPVR
ncbi:biotin-dependent carboxyltransferase family protein [Rhodococcus rhodochrous]|uniref:5-oxoprolinase subunit C family protein n=1 Tax=Rhodococcus TaxID=1827 RepID=UPI00132F38C2|nr:MULTISPECIES: biotin-dependent carboxyltransferase family protein [Rhodococcus]QHG81014.1 biotin-dependent carboxyltransferase family protein [Rhodococcus rhodochrous]WAL47037.1 biotin-dependent carboxyltransferase family protein [Rhodococcus pyridinivorans]